MRQAVPRINSEPLCESVRVANAPTLMQRCESVNPVNSGKKCVERALCAPNLEGGARGCARGLIMGIMFVRGNAVIGFSAVRELPSCGCAVTPAVETKPRGCV